MTGLSKTDSTSKMTVCEKPYGVFHEGILYEIEDGRVTRSFDTATLRTKRYIDHFEVPNGQMMNEEQYWKKRFEIYDQQEKQTKITFWTMEWGQKITDPLEGLGVIFSSK